MLVFDISGYVGGTDANPQLIDLPGFGTVKYVTDDNTQRHEPFTPIQGFVMHWTASADHMRLYAAYHWCVADNGRDAAIIRTLRPTEKGQHAWGRNTGLAGASYAATADGSRADYGPGAPTSRQREAMQLLGGEFCAWHKLDPRGTLVRPRKASNDTAIWTVPGTETFPVVMCHQTLAIPDGYGAARWDTGKLCDPDRAAIQTVYDQLKRGAHGFQLARLL